MMRKIEDIYKNYNEKIMPSKSLDNKVFNETIYKKNKKLLLKKCVVTVVICLVLSITAIGIVFAKEIKEAIRKYFVVTVTPHVGDDDKIPENIKVYDKKFLEIYAIKELNYDSDLQEVDLNDKYNDLTKPKITLGDLEQKLQIKFLRFNQSDNSEMIIMELEKNNNKIGKSTFQSVNNKISIEIQFATKYSENYKNGFSIEFLRNHAGKTIYSKEYSEKLNTDIYYTINPINTNVEYNDDSISYNQAIFVYDDIAYQLRGDRISKNMLTELIESAIID